MDNDEKGNDDDTAADTAAAPADANESGGEDVQSASESTASDE